MVETEIHWVWIIRLIDEILLLSAIFTMLLYHIGVDIGKEPPLMPQ